MANIHNNVDLTARNPVFEICDKVLVYVEWAKRMVPCKLRDVFGYLYQIKLCDICSNFNQFTYLSSASGPSNDVRKMAVMK